MANESGRRKLVLILGCVLIVAICVTAFLLGRHFASSAPPEAFPGAVRGDTVRAASPSAAGDTAPADNTGRPGIERVDGGILITNHMPREGSIAERNGQILITAEGKPGEAEEGESGKPVEPAPGKTAAPGVTSLEIRAAVKAYFLKMDALQAGPMGVNPKKFADALMSGVAKGKTGDLEKLLREVKRVQAEAKSVHPPEPCKEFHALTLEVIGGSVSMLEEMSDALARNDMTRLEMITGSAKALQAKVQRVELLQQELKREFEVFP